MNFSHGAEPGTMIRFLILLTLCSYWRVSGTILTAVTSSIELRSMDTCSRLESSQLFKALRKDSKAYYERDKSLVIMTSSEVCEA